MPLADPYLQQYLAYGLVILVLFGVFLLLREFNCWYWKINRRLALLEEILARLERLEQQQQQQLQGQRPARPRLPDITID